VRAGFRFYRDTTLTDRESEVAVLVTAGLTTQEIADRLIVSDRTIDAHLRRIMARLGFRNRAQVAAWTAMLLTLAACAQGGSP
jgi:DNA-binding CsgD family transcriptional regulator